jgi:hypothetical protein
MAVHPVNKEMVEEIKRSTNLWWPVEPENNIFQFHTQDEIKSMLGSKIDLERDRRVALEMGLDDFDEESFESVPQDFDSRAE